MYQIVNDTSVRHIPSGTVFPVPPVERFGRDYQRWLNAGNTPEPAPQPTIEERRASVWSHVKAERTRRVNGGAQVAGHWYHTDVDSRVQHMRLDAKAAALLAGGGAAVDMLTVAGQPIYWKTLSNGLVPMTAGLAQTIVAAIEVLDALAFARAETLRAQIEASEDPESIDITSGWPAIYEGSEA